MSYMAVGSRQILFSDSPAPARPQDTVQEVSALTDNQVSEASKSAENQSRDTAAQASPGAQAAPADQTTGSRIDVYS